MTRKRKGISTRTRWEVFKRDGFKCTYCGSQDELVIDHGDPFSKGGDDCVDNFVTACRVCNAGKRDSVLIPPAAEESSPHSITYTVEYDNDFHCQWASALSRISANDIALYKPHFQQVNDYVGRKKTWDIQPDFFCLSTIYSCNPIYFFVFAYKPKGEYDNCALEKMRRAVILGYRLPVMILLGSPSSFWGVVVNRRHKGCPAGTFVSSILSPGPEAWGGGYYPDESWSEDCLTDLRDVFDDDTNRSFIDPAEHLAEVGEANDPDDHDCGYL